MNNNKHNHIYTTFLRGCVTPGSFSAFLVFKMRLFFLCALATSGSFQDCASPLPNSAKIIVVITPKAAVIMKTYLHCAIDCCTRKSTWAHWQTLNCSCEIFESFNLHFLELSCRPPVAPQNHCSCLLCWSNQEEILWIISLFCQQSFVFFIFSLSTWKVWSEIDAVDECARRSTAADERCDCEQSNFSFGITA